MIKKVHVYDVDGVLVCSLHRYRTLNCGTKIDLPYWRENEYKVMCDELLPLAEQYLNDCNDDEIYVIIATSRVLHELDYQFFRDILGVPDYIVSRNGETDMRRAFDLKSTGILRALKAEKLLDKPCDFWEDNQETCEKVSEIIGCTGHYVPSLQGH